MYQIIYYILIVSLAVVACAIGISAIRIVCLMQDEIEGDL